MENKKTTLFVILGCILLIGITVSFAYYLASIQGEGKSITLKSKNLKITFTESNNLSVENISLGVRQVLLLLRTKVVIVILII